MKKIVLLMLCLLFLFSGCSKSSNDITSTLDKAIRTACNESIPEISENNCKKKYYSYYLSKNIGKLDGDDVSNLFNIDGNDAALALDVSSIALSAVDEGSNQSTLSDIGKINNFIYNRTGRYYNSDSQVIAYKITISELESGTYFVLVQTSEFIFVANVENGTLENTIHDMIVLLRTCTVNTTDLLLDYVSDNIISSSSQIITLFKDVVPETGYIIDYQDEWKSDTSFIIIDRSEQNQGNGGYYVDNGSDIVSGETNHEEGE